VIAAERAGALYGLRLPGTEIAPAAAKRTAPPALKRWPCTNAGA
jgi:hypothetical protein